MRQQILHEQDLVLCTPALKGTGFCNVTLIVCNVNVNLATK